jgi:hypothetical protein
LRGRSGRSWKGRGDEYGWGTQIIALSVKKVKGAHAVERIQTSWGQRIEREGEAAAEGGRREVE